MFDPRKLAARLAEKLESIDTHKLLVSDEVRQERLDICLSCEFLLPKVNTCKKCGCFVYAKTRLAFAECPLKKWRAVPSATNTNTASS